MTTQHITVNGRRNRFQAISGHDESTNAATTDLINILDTVDVPIVVVRQDFMVTYFNKAAADVLGLLQADIGRASRDILIFAGFARLEDRCNQVIAAGVESRVDFRDGDRWFVVRISPYKKDDRQIAGTVLTFTNVTAFRASSYQAIYERECTKAILNTIGDPLVVLSADLRIQSGNRAFYTMFGVSRDETQGVPLYELANGAFELAELRTELEEMLAGGHAFQSVEVDHVLPGKGQRTILLDARPLSLPGHSERRALLTFRDITARKQAEAANNLRTIAERKRSEEELRRSEAFLAEAQHLTSTGSYSWHVLTDEITWSDELYRIFELDPPLTTARIRTRVHPEDAPLFDKIVEQARDRGDDFEWQYRLMMPDHTVKYVHSVAHAARDQDGQLEYVGAVQDVTERRLSEEALAKARSQLAHVAKVASLGVLTASIAHEVNQPLSGIITNANTCLRMLAADPPNVDGARETARRTIRDGNRAHDVIARLRALFGRKAVAMETVDLNEATREVIALSSSDLERNRIIPRLEFDYDLPCVTGDRVQLQQVILNLIRNASDAMGAVDDRPRTLLISTGRDEGDGVCLTVRDAGVGLAPETMEHLFDAFYTTKNDGMGMGLSISRSIIESHGGRLWAALNEGPGATFSFSIPVVPENLIRADSRHEVESAHHST
jgi:PAS domain S-box-containing protein